VKTEGWHTLWRLIAASLPLPQLCKAPIHNLDAANFDHKTPRSKGGKGTLSNLQLAHPRCNVRPGNMDLAEWFTKHAKKE
jgi:5-methylcytosine-specific restriction endonuclease McrA